MIWESAFWKDDILRRSADLRKRVSQRRWPEASLARLEQSLMLGFYAVRKLIEAKKLSDATANQTLSLARYPLRPGKRVTHMNWHRVEELYDISAPRDESRDVLQICNQVIHSYVFVLGFADTGGFANVLFASDRARHDGIFLITAQQIIDLFDAVGTDYPASTQMTWDEHVGDYRVSNK